ncbi:hypothetical protein CPB86DRAFT_802326 [Serendipita vermifera]|nr:hypothetical protein CPB86DRAFT_802326 [Serendipita vermifera]
MSFPIKASTLLRSGCISLESPLLLLPSRSPLSIYLSIGQHPPNDASYLGYLNSQYFGHRGVPIWLGHPFCGKFPPEMQTAKPQAAKVHRARLTLARQRAKNWSHRKIENKRKAGKEEKKGGSKTLLTRPNFSGKHRKAHRQRSTAYSDLSAVIFGDTRVVPQDDVIPVGMTFIDRLLRTRSSIE